MNYTCFFCGRPTRENGDVCVVHDRKISSPGATGLKTRPGGQKYDAVPDSEKKNR